MMRAAPDRSWLDASLRARLRPLFALTPAELSGAARGLAYQIAEALGALPRRQVAQQIAELGKDDRKPPARRWACAWGARRCGCRPWAARASRRLLMRLQAIHAQSARPCRRWRAIWSR